MKFKFTLEPQSKKYTEHKNVRVKLYLQFIYKIHNLLNVYEKKNYIIYYSSYKGQSG